MYRIYLDGTLVYKSGVEDLALIDPVVTLEVNGAGTLSFIIPPEHPYKDLFKPLSSTLELYEDDDKEPLFVGRIIDPSEDYYKRETVTCEGALAFLNDSIQRPAEYHDISPLSYVTTLLENHNAQVSDNRKIYPGHITVVDSNNSLYRYTNYTYTLTELKEDIIDDLGGYAKVRKDPADGTLRLDIEADFDEVNLQPIEYGRNLVSFKTNRDFSEIATGVIPIGATVEGQEVDADGLNALEEHVVITDVNSGLDYLIDKELADRFGYIYRRIDYNEVHTPESLKRKGEKWLQDHRFDEITIEVEAVDTYLSEEEFKAFRVGQRVHFKSRYHGIDKVFPITAQTISLDKPSQNSITLNGSLDHQTITGATNASLSDNRKLEERQVDPNRLIQQAVNQATQYIHDYTHGYVVVENNEILIMDEPDKESATHIWRWNMGGLGYSNNGYEGPFETAITMDGTIVGKFLAANSVAAEHLDVNYRTHVETEIEAAESGANDYTDGKLKDYYTKKETEVQFKTTQDSIIASVNSTLSNYITTEELENKFEISERGILSSVSREYATLDSYNRLLTTVSNVEQSITADGIFTTINTGIKETQRIENVYFSLTRDGLTIQNSGLTIKNKNGDKVFYADSSGNLTLIGEINVLYPSGELFASLDRGGLSFFEEGSYLVVTGISYDQSSNNLRIDSDDYLTLSSEGYPVMVLEKSGITIGGTWGGTDINLDYIDSITIRKHEGEGSVRHYGYTGKIGGAEYYCGLCIGSA